MLFYCLDTLPILLIFATYLVAHPGHDGLLRPESIPEGAADGQHVTSFNSAYAADGVEEGGDTQFKVAP